MNYLDLGDVLKLHVLVLEFSGGSDGVRDASRLEAAVATQRQEVFGKELYEGVHQKAAAMMRGIIADHPFIDGNKRTGILCAVTLLETNGCVLIAKKGELEDFAVKAAVDNLEVSDIAAWLQSKTT